nr:UDP-glycosyltransferase 91A1-like [Tanacetum cinerariifolium]
MAKNGDGNLHIAMLPWLAFGHIIPFLELAKLLAIKGHKISFLSAPRNIDRIPQIPKALTSSINFVRLYLPKVENLPKNTKSTKYLPLNKVKYLKIACDGLQEPVTDFLRTSSLDWIIYDFVTCWLGPLAAEHGIRMTYFSVFPAVILRHAGYPETLMDTHATLKDYSKKPSWVIDSYRLGATIHGCEAVFVRSSLDFEPEWLNLLNQLYKKTVIPTGLLPATMAAENDTSWQFPKEWLDKHEKGSVVYIAFGTETKPNQYELTQLALGLELCGLPFYWVLIDQRGSSDNEVIELPNGFEERTRRRGVVCRTWAPQFKILSHDSVGGLLIHSGMSSVVEGFQLGKPLVLDDCNLFGGEKDGIQEGKVYREKAKEMMALFGDRDVQDKCVDDLVHFFQNSSK